jgi:sugar/nucleoside kinase (ribokinase family)
VHDGDLSTQPTAALDIVAIGSALVDVITDAHEDELARLEMVKGSMTLIDLPRARAVYGSMGPAVEVSGGSAANTAVGAAALGGRVGFLGKVAGDELGEVFMHDIVASGVELGRTTPVTPSEDPEDERATGRCHVFVTEDGERTMATYLGVASTFGPEDLDEAFVARTGMLYLEGYLWDMEPAMSAMRRAIEVAHEADALVALSLSDSFCVERHRREFLDLLHGEVDVLFANEDESTLLFGAPTFDAALSAVEETGLLGALTRGAQGSVVVTASGPVKVPAAPVASVVDTTGAGDLFAAGFLYGLTHGMDPEQCGRLGALCAGEVISHLGARPRADLRQLAADAGLL